MPPQGVYGEALTKAQGHSHGFSVHDSSTVLTSVSQGCRHLGLVCLATPDCGRCPTSDNNDTKKGTDQRRTGADSSREEENGEEKNESQRQEASDQ